MRIHLLRHGQTPHNVAGALDTARPGAGLTELGQQQARAVVPALDGEPVDAVFCSPLVRTRLTAQPLADHRGLAVTEVEGLEEISAGDHELETSAEAIGAYDANLDAWMAGDLNHTLPGGADGHAFLARYDAALRAVVAATPSGGTAVVVSHGAAIRAYLVLRLGAPDRRLANTARAVLDGDPDTGWTMTSWTGDPVGGSHLRDDRAHDVTGEPDPHVV
ncbi:histidine phosphatase family protein [Nocardioides sp. C4-1]|uniref:histidine phosphatase family protein n=1 Tax=Nocardioides sp. C4-1 TaxID=3151851 RepID=UPI0032676ABE